MAAAEPQPLPSSYTVAGYKTWNKAFLFSTAQTASSRAGILASLMRRPILGYLLFLSFLSILTLTSWTRLVHHAGLSQKYWEMLFPVRTRWAKGYSETTVQVWARGKCRKRMVSVSLPESLFSLESYTKSTRANIFNKSSEVINSQTDFSHTKQTLRESQPKSKTSVNNLDFPGKNNHQHTWRKLLADH